MSGRLNRDVSYKKTSPFLRFLRVLRGKRGRMHADFENGKNMLDFQCIYTLEHSKFGVQLCFGFITR